MVLFGVLFATLLVSRHPAVVLHADFWGEDGWFWYPGAYDLGWQSLLRPHQGYLGTAGAMVGLLSQPFPLAWAPTVFALVAIFLQVLPAVFLISARMGAAWPNPWARLAFAFVYIGLPNSYEVYANLANSQWHLAVLGFLVVVSESPSGLAGRVFDGAVLLICGLSGPFCFLLLPIAIWEYFETRSRTALFRAGMLLATAGVQGAVMIYSGHARAGAPLGARPDRFVRIVALNVLLAAILGQQNLPAVLALDFWQASSLLAFAITLAGLALAIIGWRTGPTLLRKACLLAVVTFAAALIRPQNAVTGFQWDVMMQTGWGDRYYLLPMLAWIGVLFALAGGRAVVPKYISGGLLVLMTAGISGDWIYPKMAETHFYEQARAFDQAPLGTAMRFAIHPPGAAMWLTKRR